MSPQIRNMLFVLAAAIVIVPTAKLIGREAAEAQNRRDAGVTGEPSVEAVASRQPSEGFSASDLNTESAEAIGEWSLGRIRVHTQRYLDSIGSKESANALSAETVIVEAGQQRLAVTKFKLGEYAPIAQVFGFDGTDAVRVVCIVRGADVDVPIARGPCHQKIRDTFGVSLNPAAD